MKNAWAPFAALALAASPALASSDDAWSAFRADVETACLKAVDARVTKPKIVVDPFGTEHYGVAVITGKAKGSASEQISLVCVYDKSAKTAEASEGFASDVLQVKIPKAK